MRGKATKTGKEMNENKNKARNGRGRNNGPAGELTGLGKSEVGVALASVDSAVVAGLLEKTINCCP